MRLFIGVELDDRVKAAAVDVAERLRQRLQRGAPDLVARWVPAANMHITIWFVGEVADDRGGAIRAALDPPFAETPFDLALGGCGAFPPSGPPRVFWIGAGDGQVSMQRLYAQVGERLRPLGYEPERRPYTAHLTIARVKDAPRQSGRAVREILPQIPADCGVSHISAVTLFRSRLSPHGAAYEPVQRVPLS